MSDGTHGRFRIDQIELLIRPVQYLYEEKAQCSDTCGNRFHRELLLIEQMKLKLPHVFLCEQIRALLEVAGEILNREQIQTNGFFGIVASLEFFSIRWRNSVM